MLLTMAMNAINIMGYFRCALIHAESALESQGVKRAISDGAGSLEMTHRDLQCFHIFFSCSTLCCILLPSHLLFPTSIHYRLINLIPLFPLSFHLLLLDSNGIPIQLASVRR